MSLPSLYVNLSAPRRAQEAADLGAAGVGLMRAEFLIYRSGRHPLALIADPSPQSLAAVLAGGMRSVGRAFHPRPVVYRSMDLRSNELRNLAGGDGFEELEENPALGCRGVNRSQRDPETFKAELEAISVVHGEGLDNVHLMLPFVRWPEEVVWAREQIDAAGLGPGSGLRLWLMVETPAAVLRAEELAGLVDGVSIGSNDLTQLVLGLDRDNVAFARQDLDRDPAVLAAIRCAVDRYKSHGVTVGICGDAPSRSEALLADLLDWGLDSISVSPDRVPALGALLERAAASGDGAAAGSEG